MGGVCSARDMAVVINKTNATKAMPLADLVKVVKGVTKKWPDGKNITVVIKDPGAADMKVVVAKLFGLTVEEVKALAASNKFVIVDSDAALVKAVEANPSAVGFVDIYSITGGIAVMKVEGKLPMEPGYPLHGT